VHRPRQVGLCSKRPPHRSGGRVHGAVGGDDDARRHVADDARQQDRRVDDRRYNCSCDCCDNSTTTTADRRSFSRRERLTVVSGRTISCTTTVDYFDNSDDDCRLFQQPDRQFDRGEADCCDNSADCSPTDHQLSTKSERYLKEAHLSRAYKSQLRIVTLSFRAPYTNALTYLLSRCV